MKSQLTLNYPIWILRITFMGAVILSLGLLVSKYIDQRIDISSPQANVLSYKLLFDPELIAVDKFTGRRYPLVYDFDHLSGLTGERLRAFEEGLKARIGYDPALGFAGAKITIERDSRTVLAYHYDKPAFERLEAVKETIFGDATHVVSAFPVAIRDSAGIQSGTITIEVFVQK